MIRWGYYQRQGLPLIKAIGIQRVRCTGCGRTTNVLPSFLLAHKRFAVGVATELLLTVSEHPDDWHQAVKIMIDLSTVYRWLRRFSQQANTSLPIIRTALLELQPHAQLLPEPSAPLLSLPVLIKRFFKLNQRLFNATVRLVGKKPPLITDLFCFLNYFLATHTGKALLQR